MNKIIKKFLLARDKFMSKMHLRQLGFTYSACGLFTKSKGRIQKFKERGDSRYIYQNELDKACFQYDIADFKDLPRRTASDEILNDKAFNIAKNSKYDEYQRDLPSVVYKCFDRKSCGANNSSGAIMQNQQLAGNLPKAIIRKFEKPKVSYLLKTTFGAVIFQICN